jgi:hypothetical protein
VDWTLSIGFDDLRRALGNHLSARRPGQRICSISHGGFLTSASPDALTLAEERMRRNLFLKRLACVTAISVAITGATGAAKADNLPAYMLPIAGHTASSPAETATKNLLALNSSMFELYGDAAKIFQSNILGRYPVILGLFSGGRRAVHSVSARPSPTRSTAGAGCLSATEIHRPQYDGAG